ncbi:MAG: DNA/RNA endonuclease G [Nitrospinaceae bacterium]|nr:DNA/RNA endonuclease G [Nitrospinaceae bacterium]NIR56530.1 DNA/RNA endonuclease G [Nitrospinaceae bacterium]NIS86987.1 DNA/RNA endonuclease G [Nitrospinaceae bacterium]NIT83831.1 DNA/RNA endonuclease G [Nitrospinaceae bacterium]NIW07602.1 DNA/RNA endonuclease G [Nitrospinaceae bacterium]
MPAADQYLFNRHYLVGYSYYFRQAKWALEIIEPAETPVARPNNFRSDYRVPPMFRADLDDYRKSGYDRGHLVASANHREVAIQNSETFLLSNMSPQHKDLNRRVWKDLEGEIRKLNARKSILETYVLSGPLFDFDKKVTTIKPKNKNGITLPVPHSYFKSVLTENKRGALHIWSFIIPNQATNKSVASFRVPTTLVEKYSGLFIWERLVGAKIEREKNRVRKMW